MITTGEAGLPRVGIVGAGPWARYFHAPAFADHPGTVLAGVWARRAEAAEEVAAPHGARVFADYDELLEVCDGVVFSVPPAVQAELAAVAAARGRAVLLEKPLAPDLDAAQRLVEAVEAAGVGSQMMMTWRYSPRAAALVEACDAAEVVGGRASFLLGSMLGGPFATPWRLAEGPVADLGPHVIDILDRAIGPVVDVRATGERDRLVSMLLEHENGALSQASVSCTMPLDPMVATVEIYTRTGTLHFDAAAGANQEAMTQVPAQFAATISGTPHPLDARRGLHLQRLVDLAQAQVGWSVPPA